MALVSPSLASSSPYDLAASPYSSHQSSKSADHLHIRALPTLPAPGLGPSMAGARPAAERERAVSSTSASSATRRPLPSPAPVRSPSVPPFLEQQQPRFPVPSRSASASPSRGQYSPPKQPSPAPTHSHAHTLSTSSSSSAGLARPPAAHSPPAPQHSYSPQSPPLSLPFAHFPGGPSSPVPHHFPNPQYPFIPSPHPHAHPLGYQGPGPYSPGFNGVDQQHQQRLLQAQFLQNQQWQMEMMRNHQGLPGGGFDWAGQQVQQQQQQGQSSRRRATSGPAPPQHSQPPLFPPGGQQHYSPSSTSPTQSFPQGAMHPSQGHGGYPTPPASVEGARDTSKDGYHPYRRGGGRSATTDDSTLPPKIRALPTPGTGHQANKSSSSSLPSSGSSQGRRESVSSLSTQNFPPLPTSSSGHKPSASSSSSIKVPSPNGSSHPALYALPPSQHAKNGSTSSINSSRSNSAPPRPRTDSSRSSSSSVHRSQPSSSSSRERTESTSSSSRDGSLRSPTPTGSNSTSVAMGKKPSPLSRVATPPPSGSSSSHEPSTPRPGTPGTVRGRHQDDEDSDDTTGATVAPSPPGGKDKDKDKKGLGSKFKKAFSLNPVLTDAELDGRGAKVPQRMRSDSVSSEESDALPRTPPTVGTSRPPTTGGRRFGILNSKLNSSTDNISISSTVSSASVMIRKLGQMGGKLARRNSLMSLTKAFKSNKDKDGVEAVDPSAPPKAGKKDGKDKKKGQLATANVSHVTAEIEAAQTAGMSPAAALAKKHQLQYAEQEAQQLAASAAQLAPPRSFTVHARTDSNASSDASSVKGRSWGRSMTTDDVVEGGSRAKEKEKDKLKSRKPRKWNVFGGSSKDDKDEQESDETPTPRASVEVLGPAAPAPYSTYEHLELGGTESPPGGADDYEPSLAGTPPVGGHRRDAKAVRGILKGAGSYNQDDFASPRQSRHRASSFDAPQQVPRPGSPSSAALVGLIPSEAQVDGLVSSPASSRQSSTPSSPTETLSSPAPPPAASPYANASHNASAPVLVAPSHSFGSLPLRSASTPGAGGRHIVFAANLSIHTTWPAAVYDRRAEPSTSNRLTPALAQRIKEELNAFKMEEMEVHPGSRQLTHFFV